MSYLEGAFFQNLLYLSVGVGGAVGVLGRQTWLRITQGISLNMHPYPHPGKGTVGGRGLRFLDSYHSSTNISHD